MTPRVLSRRGPSGAPSQGRPAEPDRPNLHPARRLGGEAERGDTHPPAAFNCRRSIVLAHIQGFVQVVPVTPHLPPRTWEAKIVSTRPVTRNQRYRRALSLRSSYRSDGERDAADGAQPVVLIADVDVPEPCRPPLVHCSSGGFQGSAADWPDEAGRILHPKRDLAALADDRVRSMRCDCLADRRIDAAVNDTGRLEMVRPDLEATNHPASPHQVQLQPTEIIKR
jgi:hypothetical protein